MGLGAPPLDERASVRFWIRANIPVIYKLKHAGRAVGWGGVGWGVVPRAVLLGSDREEGPLKRPRPGGGGGGRDA